MRALLYLAMALCTAGAQAQAQTPAASPAPVNQDVGVPVFPGDIEGQPYVVIGQVHAGVRKANQFSADADQRKIYRELWERAVRLGADAVINARYGEPGVSAFSWGKTEATGTAIRFSAPARPQ